MILELGQYILFYLLTEAHDFLVLILRIFSLDAGSNAPKRLDKTNIKLVCNSFLADLVLTQKR